jgi:hypothetical protein
MESNERGVWDLIGVFLGGLGGGDAGGLDGVRGKYYTPPKLICEIAKRKRKEKDNMTR